MIGQSISIRKKYHKFRVNTMRCGFSWTAVVYWSEAPVKDFDKSQRAQMQIGGERFDSIGHCRTHNYS